MKITIDLLYSYASPARNVITVFFVFNVLSLSFCLSILLLIPIFLIIIDYYPLAGYNYIQFGKVSYFLPILTKEKKLLTSTLS